MSCIAPRSGAIAALPRSGASPNRTGVNSEFSRVKAYDQFLQVFDSKAAASVARSPGKKVPRC